MSIMLSPQAAYKAFLKNKEWRQYRSCRSVICAAIRNFDGMRLVVEFDKEACSNSVAQRLYQEIENHGWDVGLDLTSQQTKIVFYLSSELPLE